MTKVSVSKLVSTGSKSAKGVVKGVANTTQKTIESVAGTTHKVAKKVGLEKVVKGTANTTQKLVEGVAGTTHKVAKKVGLEKAVKTVANTTQKSIEGVASTGVKAASVGVSTTKGVMNKSVSGVSKVNNKFGSLCNSDNIIPCITALTIVAYIVIVTPSTVLDIFSTPLGKLLSMSVVLITLLFDLKMGVLLGLAVVLSISMAATNKDVYESFTQKPSKVILPVLPAEMADSSGAPIDLDSSGTQLPPSIPTQKPATKTVAAAAKDGPKSSKPLTGLDDHLAAYAPV